MRAMTFISKCKNTEFGPLILPDIGYGRLVINRLVSAEMYCIYSIKMFEESLYTNL